MSIRTVVALTVASSLMIGCGTEDKPYEPKPPYSGKKPNVPQPPTLENKKKKEGDAYTVWGAIHDLRSVVHENDFKGKETTIIGYIVKINWADGCKDEMKRDIGEHCVPKCAVFAGGEKDTPPGCEAPIPQFWIADTKEEKNWKKNAIPVLGWASNWSSIYDAIEVVDKDGEDGEPVDKLTQVPMPNPLPNIGGQIRVKGKYGFTATVGTKGTTSNPRTGVMTYRSAEWVAKPAEPCKLVYMDE